MPNSNTPQHLGLILPLCTTSTTVGLSLLQFPVFWAFLDDKAGLAGKPLSKYWEPFTKAGGGLVVATAATSVVSGLVSMRWLQTHGHLETSAVAKWYGYGSLFAILHFVFIPLVGGPIKKMIDNGAEGGVRTESDIEASNKEEMKTWFQWHTVRTVLVDLPALWCFAEGVALAFWVI